MKQKRKNNKKKKRLRSRVRRLFCVCSKNPNKPNAKLFSTLATNILDKEWAAGDFIEFVGRRRRVEGRNFGAPAVGRIVIPHPIPRLANIWRENLRANRHERFAATRLWLGLSLSRRLVQFVWTSSYESLIHSDSRQRNFETEGSG